MLLGNHSPGSSPCLAEDLNNHYSRQYLLVHKIRDTDGQQLVDLIVPQQRQYHLPNPTDGSIWAFLDVSRHPWFLGN